MPLGSILSTIGAISSVGTKIFGGQSNTRAEIAQKQADAAQKALETERNRHQQQLLSMRSQSSDLMKYAIPVAGLALVVILTQKK